MSSERPVQEHEPENEFLSYWNLDIVAAVTYMLADSYEQGPDFDDMSSFFPCNIDDEIQYINIGNGAQTPKIVIL